MPGAPPNNSVWKGLDAQASRTQVPSPIEPHVGSGKERLGLRNIVIDRDHRTLSRRVDTSNAGFETAPLYFATMAVGREIPSSVLGDIRRLLL